MQVDGKWVYARFPRSVWKRFDDLIQSAKETMGYTYKYPKPSVTATIVVFRYHQGRWSFICGTRSPDSDAFPGWPCLPGGFINAKVETIEECASRELREETGLVDTPLSLFHVSSHPTTDPRDHVVNICFYSILLGDHPVAPGDDLTEANWVPINDPPDMAFDHGEILEKALTHIPVW